MNRLAIRLASVLVLTLGAATSLSAQSSDPGTLTLERIFASGEFRSDRFGPARWLEGEAAYTTVEPSGTVEGGLDIVRYDAATGAREVWIPASQLVPEGAQGALEVEDHPQPSGRARDGDVGHQRVAGGEHFFGRLGAGGPGDVEDDAGRIALAARRHPARQPRQLEEDAALAVLGGIDVELAQVERCGVRIQTAGDRRIFRSQFVDRVLLGAAAGRERRGRQAAADQNVDANHLFGDTPSSGVQQP